MSNSNQFQSAGSIRLHTDDVNLKRSGRLVALKLLATTAMIGIGFLVVMPSIPLPMLPSFGIAAGLLLLYVGVAFFIRPEPNTDNLGGGLGRNDITQVNDNINRALVNLYMFLGPGRFVSETIIEAATLAGWIPERTETDLEQEREQQQQTDAQLRRAEIEARIQTRGASREHQGTVQLSSLKYLQPSDEPGQSSDRPD